MKYLDGLLQLPGAGERGEGDAKRLVVGKTAAADEMEEVPEEVDVAGLADDVEEFVEGDGGVREGGLVGFGEEEEAVDGTP